jgi:hypothetical protein
LEEAIDLSGDRQILDLGGMTDEVERFWKKAVVAQRRYHIGIYLEGLRKTTKA